jgi:aldose sugar dehydrogenase
LRFSFTGALLTLILFMSLVGASPYLFPLKSVHFASALDPRLKDPNFELQLVTDQLDSPSTIAFLNSSHILALEKDKGTVRMVANGNVLPMPLLDAHVANKYERGMLGIAISPATEANITNVYLYYTEAEDGDGKDVCWKSTRCSDMNEPMGNRLYRYDLSKDKTELLNPQLLLDLPASPGAEHNGGIILMRGDGNLYLTVGAVASTKSTVSNKVSGTDPDGRGGILLFNENGKPLDDGILGSMFPLNLYYSYGIRNSFGIDIDTKTGKLWDTENGPGFGDEINLVEPGFNSGWNKVQGIWKRESYDGGPIELNPEKILEDFGGKGKYSIPEFTWNVTVGPTAIKFLNSDKYGQEYENDMFVGSNNNGGVLYHFELAANRTSLDLDKPLDDRIASNYNESKSIVFGEGFGIISDLKIGPDGYLYIVSLPKGSIYRVVPIENDTSMM